MALQESQKQTIRDLKAKGYTEAQVLSFFGANEMGRSNSSIHNAERKEVQVSDAQQAAQAQSGKSMSEKFTGAIGLGGATDVFSDLLARQVWGRKLKSKGRSS